MTLPNLPRCLFLIGPALALAACATGPDARAGLKPGEFVAYRCADGKVFQARLAAEGTSVRVRALHGSAELNAASAGLFKGDDYELDTRPEGGASLNHKGKPEATACRPA